MTPFIVAELGASHNGNFDRAMALVEAAAKAGADAIKLQTYTASQMVDENLVIEAGPWAGRNALELYRECETPRSWHAPLFARAKELGMIGFSSAFHVDDVAFLESIGCEMLKISSFEILDLPLIRCAAATKKPLIISCGMATEDEISEAVLAAAGNGSRDVTLLKCTSAYPAETSDANLKTMRWLWPAGYRYIFAGERKVGISDHTLGLAVPVAATALGASMIEKHLTLSRADGGPDAAFSSEPAEFRAMVDACREAAAALGEVRYGPTPSEMSSLPLRRKPGGKRGS